MWPSPTEAKPSRNDAAVKIAPKMKQMRKKVSIPLVPHSPRIQTKRHSFDSLESREKPYAEDGHKPCRPSEKLPVRAATQGPIDWTGSDGQVTGTRSAEGGIT